MSEALTRVIAEQQAEIDQLKARDKLNLESWMRENRLHEQLVEATLGLMNYPDAPYAKQRVQDALRAYGWCLTCECRPCECWENE